MRAQQPVELAWDEIPLHTQLDVLIYDMIEADTGLLSRAGHASTPVTPCSRHWHRESKSGIKTDYHAPHRKLT